MLGTPGSCSDPTCLGALWKQIQVQVYGQLPASSSLGLGQRERDRRGPALRTERRGWGGATLLGLEEAGLPAWRGIPLWMIC